MGEGYPSGGITLRQGGGEIGIAPQGGDGAKAGGERIGEVIFCLSP